MAPKGFRRRPSSLYTFPSGRAGQAWLGIGMARRPKLSPTLSGFTPAVSAPGAQFLGNLCSILLSYGDLMTI